MITQKWILLISRLFKEEECVKIVISLLVQPYFSVKNFKLYIGKCGTAVMENNEFPFPAYVMLSPFLVYLIS